ncbi:hypothetical protein [Clostridium ihumii]|uniref:hypothetical protein n=1 Tax=Clostridium ihumii TaxID=1470356 RepID=UPI00058D9E2D|nr:hypothetical protein [Clostridium ihumii]
MSGFLILILFFSCCGLGGYSYNLMLKANKENTKCRVLSKRNSELQQKLKLFEQMSENNITVSYLPLEVEYGEVISSTSMHVGPVTTLPTLRNVLKGTRVEVVDCCEAYGIIWYEVKLILAGEYKNLKGFVMKNQIKPLNTISKNIEVSKIN